MDNGIHYFNIIDGNGALLAGDFVLMNDVDLYYKQSCIFSVRFFPDGMGDDSSVPDDEYLVDRRSPLDAPPVPLDRHRPAFELRRHVPPMSDLRCIVNGHKGARLCQVRVIARGEEERPDGGTVGGFWKVSWAGLAPVEGLTHRDLAQRLLKGALDIAARYEALANARKKR